MAACGRNRVEVSETGLKYQLHDDNKETRKSKVGDIWQRRDTRAEREFILNSEAGIGERARLGRSESRPRGSL